jgi:hypothetical protein
MTHGPPIAVGQAGFPIESSRRDQERAEPKRTSTEPRPSRGPWLAIGLRCPVGSSLTTASSETLNPSPPRTRFAAGPAAPKEIGLRWEPRGSPTYPAGLCSPAASLTPVAPKSPRRFPSWSSLVSDERKPAVSNGGEDHRAFSTNDYCSRIRGHRQIFFLLMSVCALIITASRRKTR